MTTALSTTPVILCLEDGSRFSGLAVGSVARGQGEVVFNTSMTGYQEICTDPSYTGQMVVMTYPHIGNTGVNLEDVESRRPWISAMITGSYHGNPSNWRSTQSLHEYLNQAGIPLLTNVDTRRLVRHIRSSGAMNAVIMPATASDAEIKVALAKVPNMTGQDLTKVVSTETAYEWKEPLHALSRSCHPERSEGSPHVVVIDYGVKYNILRNLVSRGCAVTVVPGTASSAEIQKLKPDGILLSNGPGDPAAVTQAPQTIRDLMPHYPIFGICLGHQLLALAVGAKTFKLKFGHRGANQPVKNLQSGLVTITSQNHGFAVDSETLPHDCEATEINLNDGTNQGLRHKTLPVFSVQYHPEASPGPHDASLWFDTFIESVTTQNQ